MRGLIMVLLCVLFENGAPLKKAKDREKIRDVKWAGTAGTLG